MNIFNRVLIIILLLVSIAFWVAAVAVILLFPGEALSAAKFLIVYLEANLTLYTQLMVALLGFIFILASLLLLVIELTPSRPGAVQLTQVTSGTALLATDAIAERIKHDLQGVPGVHRADPTVIARGKFVDVNLDLHTGPGSDVSETSEQVGRLVRDSVEKKMGVKIGKLVVHIHHERVGVQYEPAVSKATPQPAEEDSQPPIYIPGAEPSEKKAPEERED